MKMFEIRAIAVGNGLQGSDLAKKISDVIKEDLGATLGSLVVSEIQEITQEELEDAFDLGGDVIDSEG